MMEHTCQGMTLADHSKAICTICGADLSKPNHKELLAAIERVRKLHEPWLLLKKQPVCSVCVEIENQNVYWVEYPCPTIQALDGEQ